MDAGAVVTGLGLPGSGIWRVIVHTLKPPDAMIYIEHVQQPVFRVMEVDKDRMRVILFDPGTMHYVLRWVPSQQLVADDRADMRMLQADPVHYAPNLEEVHDWVDHHRATSP